MAKDGPSGDKVKIIMAVVALVAAGLALAWNFGAFDKVTQKPVEVPVITPEQEKAIQKMQKDQEASGVQPG
jgi:hypothetical protein